MKLSLYTFVRNGLRYDFHVVEMLKHHLPLVDELIVNEGYRPMAPSNGSRTSIRRSTCFGASGASRRAWSGIASSRTRRASAARVTGVYTSTAMSSFPSGSSSRSAELEHRRRGPDPDRRDQFLRELPRLPRPSREGALGVAQTRHSPQPAGYQFGATRRTCGSAARTWSGPRDPMISAATISATSGTRRGCGKNGGVRMRSIGRVDSSCHPDFVFDLLPHRWNDPGFLGDLEVDEGR